MGVVVALLWLVQVVDSLSGYPFLRFGIEPRTPGRLEYILTAPFIHASYAHLIGNTIPLAVLGFLVAVRGIGRLFAVSAIVICVSGLGVWLTAPSTSDTVGASGVIFGYLGYLVASGIFDRRFVDVLVAVLVGVLYWSFIPDLLPGHPGISWQGHLFGLIGGVLAAWVFRARPREVAVRPAAGSSPA